MNVKKALMVAALFMTVGCIDIPAMNGLIDRIVPQEPKEYQPIEVWNGEGSFAVDQDQDPDALQEAVVELVTNPLDFQKTIQNLSWEEYEHNFVIESQWNARFVLLLLTVNYEVGGSFDPSEGPSGTLDISIRDPNGGEHADGYEMASWNGPINERPYLLPATDGEWIIRISGSGLQGLGSEVYSGSYTITVESEKLV